MWGSVRNGDWVKADGEINTGLFAGPTISAGTKGVVIGVSTGWFSSRAEVEFDSGLGTVRATVPAHQLRLVRRNGGLDRFLTRQRRLSAARAALFVFLAWPVAWWCVQYVWQNKGTDGISAAFALGVIDSLGQWLTMFIANPAGTLVYVAFLWALARLAWR